MINWGRIPIGAVLPFPFTTYGKTNGESITLTGLAVTDIEVYKGTSMTQRSSDSGYALMDTDGIDIDSVTGFHGFSIDTGDNTDAGFYAAGSFYTVLVSAITVDGQTVSFIAGTFICVPAESSAGVAKVDVSHYGGTAGTFSGGRPEVNATLIEGSDATNQIRDSVLSDATRFAGADIATIKSYIDTEIAAILAAVDTEITDIQARLPAALLSGRMDVTVGAMQNNVLTAAATAADFGTEIADAILDRDMSVGTDSGSTTVRTVRQALRHLRNRWVVSGGTLTVYKEDDATASWTAAATGTTGADPVTELNPAGP